MVPKSLVWCGREWSISYIYLKLLYGVEESGVSLISTLVSCMVWKRVEYLISTLVSCMVWKRGEYLLYLP